MSKVVISFCLIILCFSTSAQQSVIHGLVADSVSLLPLSNVSVKVQGRDLVTISDLRGRFTISATDTDTLLFSSVGYHSQAVAANTIKNGGIVLLAEAETMLKTIEIKSDNLPAYLKEIPTSTEWQNTTQSKSFIETPGFQGLQTFGPGYVFNGPISTFSKSEREEKKLEDITQENYQAKKYIAIVTAPEVKGRIMTDYNLTEEEYNKLLAEFNEKNKDIIYQLGENELISMLLTYYEESVKK